MERVAELARCSNYCGAWLHTLTWLSADLSVGIPKQQYAAMGLDKEDVITLGGKSIAAALVVTVPLGGGLGESLCRGGCVRKRAVCRQRLSPSRWGCQRWGRRGGTTDRRSP